MVGMESPFPYLGVHNGMEWNEMVIREWKGMECI